MSSSSLSYQDSVSKGLSGIMCEGQNVLIVDMEHEDSWVFFSPYFSLIA